MKKNAFFMRFYDLEKDEVNKVIIRMQEGYFFKYEIFPPEKSCNMFIPENSWQVDLEFDDEQELDRFRKDPNIIAAYLAAAPTGAILEKRAPEDMAYQVRG